MEMRLASMPKMGSPTERSALRELAHVAVRRHVTGLEMNLGHAPVILANEAVEDLGIDAARVLVDPPHDPEIERDDIPVRGDLQVPLMHVGVKEPVA